MFSLFAILLLCIQFKLSMAVESSTMYVFAYSWTPGFCMNESYPGCMDPLPYWKNNFTVHGLWPQYVTSGYPSTCTTEKFDSSIPSKVGLDTLISRWPDVKYTINNTKYDSFWEHEWSKHGTCSGLTQYDYFMTAIRMTDILLTPDIFHKSVGTNINTEELRMLFGPTSTISLQCSHQSLVGVYSCWQQKNNVPTKLVACPDDVLQEDTCKSKEETYIPAL
jgi:ribonuclease T2